MDINQNPYQPINENNQQVPVNQPASPYGEPQQTYSQQPYGNPTYLGGPQPMYQGEPQPVRPVSRAKAIVAVVLSANSLVMALLSVIYVILGAAMIFVFNTRSLGISSQSSALYGSGAGMGIVAFVFAVFGLVFAIVALSLRKSYLNAGANAGKLTRASQVMGIIGLVLNILFLVISSVVMSILIHMISMFVKAF